MENTGNLKVKFEQDPAFNIAQQRTKSHPRSSDYLCLMHVRIIIFILHDLCERTFCKPHLTLNQVC